MKVDIREVKGIICKFIRKKVESLPFLCLLVKLGTFTNILG